MKRACAILMCCAGFVCSAALGQKSDSKHKVSDPKGSLDQASLDQTTERGRALYAYDQAGQLGRYAFLALHPDTLGLAHFVCQKSADGWVVVFGRFNAAKDKFLVVYEARDAGHPGEFTAKKLDTPREESGFIFEAEKAVETSLSVFETPNRPYNVAVLPAPGGNLYVYLYPSQIKPSIWPFGGDIRFVISPDGTRILERRQMHKTILDRENIAGMNAGYQVHLLSGIPEDTDVFYVLNHKPSVAEYVSTDKNTFKVATDGSITIVKQ